MNWKIPEFITLIFHGHPRVLKFKPNIDVNPANPSFAPILKFRVSLTCYEHIMVTLTPLANIMFKHSKDKCGSKDPSVTLAFRRGIPLEAAMKIYPHLKRFKNLN